MSLPQEALDWSAKQGAIMTRLLQIEEQDIAANAKQIDALIGQLLASTAQWDSGPVDFINWVLNAKFYDGQTNTVGFADAGRVPQRMTCWEAILYAATQAGLTTRAALGKRQDAIGDQDGSEQLAKEVLGYANARELRLADGVPMNIQKGDILFIFGTSHVVVARDALGGVAQLWSWTGSAREATLEEILQEMSSANTRGRAAFMQRFLRENRNLWDTAAQACGLKDFDAIDAYLADVVRNGGSGDTLDKLWSRFFPPLPTTGTTPQIRVSTPNW